MQCQDSISSYQLFTLLLCTLTRLSRCTATFHRQYQPPTAARRAATAAVDSSTATLSTPPHHIHTQCSTATMRVWFTPTLISLALTATLTLAVAPSMDRIPAKLFYQTWHGHTVEHLQCVLTQLRRQHYSRLIWLAGDSSLDNKAWVQQSGLTEPAAKPYQSILTPPLSAPDVCHWINVELDRLHAADTACIMTAVEATTLGERDEALRPQDDFIAAHIGSHDMLVVSVGGNDIALSPSSSTMLHLAALLVTPSQWMPRSLLVRHPSFQYFVRLFRDRVTDYIHKLTAHTTPSRIAVCMIYYPCEQADGGSWSQRLLSMVGYDRNPKRLQHLIKLMYEEATSKIDIANTTVVPIALFDILDAADAEQYVQRVEPSSSGGRRMAQKLVEVLLNERKEESGESVGKVESVRDEQAEQVQ